MYSTNTFTDKAALMQTYMQLHNTAGLWLLLAGSRPWRYEDQPIYTSPYLKTLPDPVCFVAVHKCTPVIPTLAGTIVTPQGTFLPLNPPTANQLDYANANHLVFEARIEAEQAPLLNQFRLVGLTKITSYNLNTVPAPRTKGLILNPEDVTSYELLWVHSFQAAAYDQLQMRLFVVRAF